MNAAMIERAMTRLGYVFFTNDTRPFNMNIIGVRSRARRANEFDDRLAVAWKYNGRWTFEDWPVTTDPGGYYLRNLINPAGCAILVPGQYRGCYALDLHQGKYRTLCQRLGPVRVYRDADHDDVLDLDPATINTGMFGINIHRAEAGGITALVNRHSAGCQVFQNSNDHTRFVAMCDNAVNFFPNAFTYTLLNEEQLAA